ncbi:MAG: deoxyguanosinetriphosphate triphosphohydrolase [Desulfobacterales bacterium]|nr:deoxyguanosinetriphosphate triphosphohydrolase [Desulfobacterales bacterium]
MSIRTEYEQRQGLYLSPYACPCTASKGRLRPEKECPIRNPFHRDRNRIVYSKAFRRLKHKTQVFLAPMGDHYRTRLTHTLEVSEIGRTLARALRLNEDLVEAVSLGHDLGHTPFGHAGETVLNELIPGGFSHFEQSLRVVDFLENNGAGLNLTFEVRNGIAKHSKGYGEVVPRGRQNMPDTAEGCLVRYADIIAYLSHDLDDAIASRVIRARDIPDICIRVLGDKHSRRVMNMIQGLLDGTRPENGELVFNFRDDIAEAIQELRNFQYHKVYRAPQVHNEFEKGRKVLREIFFYCLENAPFLEKKMGGFARSSSRERRIGDFIASMTDRYALSLYRQIFEPRSLV